MCLEYNTYVTWGVQDVVQKVQVKMELLSIKMNKIRIDIIIKEKDKEKFLHKKYNDRIIYCFGAA